MNYATKLCFALISLFLTAQHASSASLECEGQFPNLVTDICWSCAFPIKFANISIPLSAGVAEDDTSSPGGNPVCVCGANVGTSVSFWEPIRHVDVVRNPWCLTTLGGVMLNPGLDVPPGTQTIKSNSDMSSFYQAHWYVDPIFGLLQVVMDSKCMEQAVFDLAYLTELDPLWNDDVTTSILNPDSFLFGNLISQLACAADCVSASIGFGLNSLFWCAGCNGSLYPLNGHVAAHVGGVQASSLIVQRLTAKMHREGLIWAADGTSGMCGYYPQLMMDKNAYKYQMHFPVPQNKINGLCCQPMGRTTVLWGADKEIPAVGEDYAYMLFRKRDCCQGAF